MCGFFKGIFGGGKNRAALPMPLPEPAPQPARTQKSKKAKGAPDTGLVPKRAGGFMDSGFITSLLGNASTSKSLLGGG